MILSATTAPTLFKEDKMYIYGMKSRGFSPGCQPKHDFVDRLDDDSGKYWDLLVYKVLLSGDEMRNYELEYVGETDEK